MADERGQNFSSLYQSDTGVANPVIERMLVQVADCFKQLDEYPYLRTEDKLDFAWYQRCFTESLLAIDRRIGAGQLDLVAEPSGWPLTGWRSSHPPQRELHAAVFIGSFDPFQMTHLAMALRYLASDQAAAPLVYVIPEGYDNPSKPHKCAYEYRYNLLSMQIGEIFKRLIIPLDLGRGADTIEIVKRFIGHMPDCRLRLTHIIGSDVLPYAAAMLPEDLRVWRAEAEHSLVDFSYDVFILCRRGKEPDAAALAAIRAMGLAYHVDDRQLHTPSSSDFREHSNFAIVFPTAQILKHLEVLFRYRLNKPWYDGCPDGEG